MLRILFWPFELIWWIIGLVFDLLGFIISLTIGLILTILGAVLTFTIVGAFIGIPLIVFGLLLAVRSFF
ncbi:MAG: hypothetical protein E7476_07690 [Ruminococcaceae bacterium]|nr:hypothetical protein [Oscillospiraceae bacterium]